MPELASRISSALQAEARAAKRDGNLISGWRMEVGEAVGVSADAVRDWCFGYSVPGGDSLLKLFDHFGPVFESAVRGHPVGTDELTKRRMAVALRRLADEVEAA